MNIPTLGLGGVGATRTPITHIRASAGTTVYGALRAGAPPFLGPQPPLWCAVLFRCGRRVKRELPRDVGGVKKYIHKRKRAKDEKTKIEQSQAAQCKTCIHCFPPSCKAMPTKTLVRVSRKRSRSERIQSGTACCAFCLCSSNPR